MKKTVDYAGIRGFNYTQPNARDDCDFWLHYSHEIVERDMGYAKRLRLNSARIFLSYAAYRNAPDAFFENVKDFVRTEGILPQMLKSCWKPASLRPTCWKRANLSR